MVLLVSVIKRSSITHAEDGGVGYSTPSKKQECLLEKHVLLTNGKACIKQSPMAKEIGNFSSLLVSLSERACLVFSPSI